MPQYDYLCLTLKGEWLKGEFEAADKTALATVLWRHKLFLVSWVEMPEQTLDPGTSTESSPMGSLQPISEEEGRARWQRAPENQRVIPQVSAAIASIPSLPRLKIVQWMIDHSHGAITNGRDALLVLSVITGFLLSAVHISRYGLHLSSRRASSPFKLPEVTQPSRSVKKFNGQRRRTKTYSLKNVRASLVKTTLDHVMRESSMTSDLSPLLDNALIIQATALDLGLLDTIFPLIDKDYGEGNDSQIMVSLIETMASARRAWMIVPHKEPEPTPEELKEIEMEKLLGQEKTP